MIELLASTPGATPVVLEAIYPVSAERLFRAWTEPGQICKWFGNDPNDLRYVELDAVVGGRWRFDMQEGRGWLEGEYLEVQCARKLVFTWSHYKVDEDGATQQTPPSRVTISFEPYGQSTKMTLEHAGIVTEGGRSGVLQGWTASFHALAATIQD